jgi:hypothetical protein
MYLHRQWLLITVVVMKDTAKFEVTNYEDNYCHVLLTIDWVWIHNWIY